jgi:hypothetical protein
LPTDALDFACLQLLNEQLVSVRQAAEWGMHSIQGSNCHFLQAITHTNSKFFRLYVGFTNSIVNWLESTKRQQSINLFGMKTKSFAETSIG